MKKMILWDYNGVIIDDARACYEADLAVNLHFGGCGFTFQDWQKNCCIPGIDFYAKFGCSLEELRGRADEMGEVFHGVYEPLADQCGLRIGARKALAFTQENRIASVICSNHTVPEIYKQLHRFRIAECFAAVLGNTDKKTAHLSHTKFDRVREHLGTDWDPATIVIIGDTTEEVEKIGKVLGIITVAITGGYYHTERLVKSNPDHLISRVDQLISIVKE